MSYAYPLVFALGALAALLWLGLVRPESASRAQTARALKHADTRFDAGLLTLASGIIGSRLGFILFHEGYFTQYPAESLMLWEGGLSWVGGYMGALVGLYVFSLWRKITLPALADLMALPGAILASAAWMGCLLDGCAYGRLAPATILTPQVADMYGGVASRWPTQFVGVVLSLATVGLLHWVGGKVPRGVLACTSSIALSAIALGLSFTRSDPVMLLSGIRADTVGAAALLIFALAALVSLLRKEERRE